MLAGKSYDLCAVVVHRGSSMVRGHYVCYVRRGSAWYLTDDRTVSGPMSWDEMAAHDEVWTGAYVLLYEERGTDHGE